MPNPGTFPIKGLKIELEGGVALDLTPEETTAALQVILSFHRKWGWKWSCFSSLIIYSSFFLCVSSSSSHRKFLTVILLPAACCHRQYSPTEGLPQLVKLMHEFQVREHGPPPLASKTLPHRY